MKTLISVFQDEFSVFLEILKLIVLFNVQKNFLLPSVCGRLLAYILFRLSTVSNCFGRSVYLEAFITLDFLPPEWKMRIWENALEGGKKHLCFSPGRISPQDPRFYFQRLLQRLIWICTLLFIWGMLFRLDWYICLLASINHLLKSVLRFDHLFRWLRSFLGVWWILEPIVVAFQSWFLWAVAFNMSVFIECSTFERNIFMNHSPVPGNAFYPMLIIILSGICFLRSMLQYILAYVSSPSSFS